MSQVVLLKVETHDPNHYRRQYEDLSLAYERNQDLGSRDMHIRAGRDRLRQLYVEFEKSVREIDGLLALLKLKDVGLEGAFDRFTESAKHLNNIGIRVHQLTERP